MLQPSSELTFFIVKDLACFAALCLGLSLLNTLVRVYSVFMCCCSATFSASFVISSVHFLLSTLTCLLTSNSLSFCRHSSCHLCFGLSDLAPISFCLIWFSFGLAKPKPPDWTMACFSFSCTLVPPLPFWHKLSPLSRFFFPFGLLVLLFYQSLCFSTASALNLFFSCMVNLLCISWFWSFCVSNLFVVLVVAGAVLGFNLMVDRTR